MSSDDGYDYYSDDYSDGGYDDDSGGYEENGGEDSASADGDKIESSADDDRDDGEEDDDDSDGSDDSDLEENGIDDSGDSGNVVAFNRLRDSDSDSDSSDFYSDQDEIVYLEFDGASKGNPGRAGGGVVLKSGDGTVITRICEGLGWDTNNGAEYKALIQGLETALKMGYDHINVKGDSELVVKQVQGLWKTRNDNMARLCERAKQLKDQFKEFKISHVPRGQNSDADAAANKGANLPAGKIHQENNWNYNRRR